MKRALEITGSYKGSTGHDHHTRSIVRALRRRGIDIQLHDLPNWSPAKLPRELQDPWFDTLQEPVGAEVHLYFCMPHQVQPVDGQRIVNFTMFEADRIPQSWVKLAERHDLIVVPVNSCRQAWTDSGVSAQKVAICSLGVDSQIFTPRTKRLKMALRNGRGTDNCRVRFLNVSDVNERKNLLGLLRVWLTATKSTDDAALIIKAAFTLKSVHERFLDQLHSLESAVGKTLADAAPVFWVDRTFPDAEMPLLYGSATHYISASRGEGFDLPMVEAGACGLKLIAPRHTSYLDYLNDDIAYLISAEKVQARLPNDPKTEALFTGAHWWEPNQDELCQTVRAIIDGTSPDKTSARDSLLHLSWESTAQNLEKLIFNS